MEQNQPLVTISLVTYNGQKYLKDCLSSIASQSYSPLEVLIADNHSTDKSSQLIKELKQPSWSLVLNQANKGFAQSHNFNITQSQGQYFCCLNQDVVLDSHFIKEAVSFLEKDEAIGALQAKVLRNSDQGKLKKIDTTGLVIFKNRRVINRGQGQDDVGQYQQSEEVFGADGACPVYRRKALEDIKIKTEYFDQDFFCYKEDVDLSWRLRLANWKIFYCPQSLAWHWRGSGDSAAKSFWAIIKERRKINQKSKLLSFRNQRLMQIKNELISSFLIHLPWILIKEIAAWCYVLVFERYSWPALVDIFKKYGAALEKRKLIMAKRKVTAGQISSWFK